MFLGPLLELFRNTAALALLPVFVLILGLGETSKISIIVYGCAWPILLNTISGVKTVDPLLVKSARSMGLSQLRLFQKVVLPAAVPTIFTGIRLAGSYSVLILIAAETGRREGRPGLPHQLCAAELRHRRHVRRHHHHLRHRPGHQPVPGVPGAPVLHLADVMRQAPAAMKQTRTAQTNQPARAHTGRGMTTGGPR